MADAVLAASLQPYRRLPDGAIAIGVNSLTMIAVERIRMRDGRPCASSARVNDRTERSWRQVNRRHWETRSASRPQGGLRS